MDLDVNQLKKNDFFSGFADGEIKKLIKEGNINRFREGSSVFLQGDPGEAMYILLTGEVEILLAGKEPGVEEMLADLKPGDVFGEGSFAAGITRSAKAVARKDTYLYVITADHLDRLITKQPTIAAKMLNKLLKIVIGRLVITNKKLAATT